MVNVDAEPQFIPGCAELWHAFWELGTSRTTRGDLLGPIPYETIESWLEKYPRAEWEKSVMRYALRELDFAFLKWMADDSKKGSRRTVSDQEMTPELFDQIF